MATKKTLHSPTDRDKQVYANVLADFKRNRRYSFHAWCKEIGESHGNVEKAIKRIWRGEKGKLIRKQAMQASKVKRTQESMK